MLHLIQQARFLPTGSQHFSSGRITLEINQWKHPSGKGAEVSFWWKLLDSLLLELEHGA